MEFTWWTALELMATVFDTVISVQFFSRILQVKPNAKLWAASLAYFVLLAGVNALRLDITLNMVLTFLLWTVVGYAFFDGKLAMRAFSSILLMGFFVLSDTVASLLLIAVSGADMAAMSAAGIHRAMGIVISKTLLFVFTRAAVFLKRRKDSAIPFSYWAPLMLVPLCSLLTALLLYNLDWNYVSGAVSLPLLFFVVTGLLFINVFVFYLFDRYAASLHDAGEAELMRRQLALQERHYEELSAQQEETRRLWHDMRNHLLCLENMKASGTLDLVDSYISELNGQLEAARIPFNTGIAAIDTVLSVKYQTAKKEGITVSATASVTPCDTFRRSDLCSLLSNIWDNAIEACVGNTQLRYIDFSFSESDCYWIVSCRNPLPEQARKKEGDLHGIGLKSIRTVAALYGGNVTIDKLPEEFRITVILCKNPSFASS